MTDDTDLREAMVQVLWDASLSSDPCAGTNAILALFDERGLKIVRSPGFYGLMDLRRWFEKQPSYPDAPPKDSDEAR